VIDATTTYRQLRALRTRRGIVGLPPGVAIRCTSSCFEIRDYNQISQRFNLYRSLMAKKAKAGRAAVLQKQAKKLKGSEAGSSEAHTGGVSRKKQHKVVKKLGFLEKVQNSAVAQVNKKVWLSKLSPSQTSHTDTTALCCRWLVYGCHC
jgi:hypothetical protein